MAHAACRLCDSATKRYQLPARGSVSVGSLAVLSSILASGCLSPDCGLTTVKQIQVEPDAYTATRMGG
jgi:hypothetical protein